MILIHLSYINIYLDSRHYCNFVFLRDHHFERHHNIDHMFLFLFVGQIHTSDCSLTIHSTTKSLKGNLCHSIHLVFLGPENVPKSLKSILWTSSRRFNPEIFWAKSTRKKLTKSIKTNGDMFFLAPKLRSDGQSRALILNMGVSILRL